MSRSEIFRGGIFKVPASFMLGSGIFRWVAPVSFRLFGGVKREDRPYCKILKEMFGIYPDNIELYKLALVHRSASLILPDGKPINNERLEFLGDAVLESIVSDYIFIEYPSANEGFMTQLRSRIVSRHSLNQLAVSLGLDKYIIAQGVGNFMQRHVYGDAFEAMVGAMYLDKGYDFVNRLLINEIFPKYIDFENLTGTEIDFKSRLLEWGQKMKRQVVFESTESPLSAHNKPHFTTVVLVDDKETGNGEGYSKKEAEQAAAHAAWEKLAAAGLNGSGNGNGTTGGTGGKAPAPIGDDVNSDGN